MSKLERFLALLLLALLGFIQEGRVHAANERAAAAELWADAVANQAVELLERATK